MRIKITGRLIFYPALLILLSILFNQQLVLAFTAQNGFDLSNSLINVQDIHHGGPAKDGIPALDKPVFVTPEKASYLSPDDRILGLSLNGISKAYPVKILNYHEIVNDFFAEQAVVIAYCPLCGSGTAYNAQIKGQNTSFGVSGLLYNSDVLLYDRATDSLWSQLLSKAISGPRQGELLSLLVLQHTTWKDWHKQHPETQVLSNKTGYNRDYSRSPYGAYDKETSLYFPVSQLDKRYHPKEYVIGLNYQGKTKVYPFSELAKMQSPFNDRVAGQDIKIVFDAKNRTGRILNDRGNEIPTITAFWFAWMAFYPQSDIFKAVK